MIAFAILLSVFISNDNSLVEASEQLVTIDNPYEIAEKVEIEPFALVEHGTWEDSGKLRFGITNPGVPNVRVGKTIDHIFSGSAQNTLPTTSGLEFISESSPTEPEEMYFKNGKSTVVDGMPAISADSKMPIAVGVGLLTAKVEMVRTSPGIVEHRYKITNISPETAEFYPFKAVDTMLAGNDNVPIKSLGRGKGIYIESSGYLLRYMMDSKTGPKAYSGGSYGNNPLQAFGDLDNPDKDQMSEPEGAVLYENGDTAVYQIWPKTTLKMGQSVTISYEVSIEVVDALKVTKTGENKTNKKSNNVGDNYEYTVKMSTQKDPYKKVKIVDTLPEGLAKPSKISLKTGTIGGTQALDVEKVYDETTRQITVENIDIAAKSSQSLIYETLIEGEAQGQVLINKAVVSGIDGDDQAYVEEVEHEMYVEEIALGRVLVNYVDSEGETIADEDIYSGEVETAYPEIKAKAIPGYVLVETEGPVEGNYQPEDQHVTFTYLEVSKGFELKHEGTNSTGKKLSEGVKVKQGEQLTYSLNLNSLEELNDVQGVYSKINFTLKLAEELENVSNIQVLTNDGQEIGQGSYDEATRTITGELTAKDVAVQESINLTYQTTVKKETDIGAIIKSSGSVKGEIVQGEEAMALEELTSNELANEIEAGMLEFISAPTALDFGKDLLISHKDETYGVNELEGEALIVQDNRSPGNSWEVTAAIITELTSSLGVLDEALYYGNGQTDLKLTSAEQVVEARTTEDGNAVNLSEGWNETKGIRLKVKAGQAKAASYTGEIRWTLRNVPNK